MTRPCWNCGDLDIAVAPILTARLDALTAHPRPDLVVDLGPVPFLDCSALGVLCRARRRIRERHGGLRLVSGDDRLRVVLGHTGLANAFSIHASLQDALRSPRNAALADGLARAAAPERESVSCGS
ncbi:STAS domain-containing protein [Streptomyces fumanus]|uniref:STAS domain-containing protein n=1 Tax=Streptomyces fumanus TaxID=67302 RepID=UPI00167D6565|nr:STAS domain-containing protein [Streptomyces fumanus]